MEFNKINFPALPGEASNPAVAMSKESKLNPLSAGAFAPRENDEFVFDVHDENGDIYAVEQSAQDPRYKNISIACHRNGKPSWIGQGHLVRLNTTGATCPAVADMRAKGTVADLHAFLKSQTEAGKKLKVTSMEKQTFRVFGSADKTEERMTPILSWI